MENENLHDVVQKLQESGAIELSTPIFIQHADDIFKFFIMFLVGCLIGVSKYLNNLPIDEEIRARYLISSLILHGSLGSMAGIGLLFLPIDNLLVLIGLSAFLSYIGVDLIQRLALAYAADKLGIKINGNGKKHQEECSEESDKAEDKDKKDLDADIKQK